MWSKINISQIKNCQKICQNKIKSNQKSPGAESHAVGADTPDAQKLPAGQTDFAMLDMTEPPTQNEPGGQTRHDPSRLYDPGKHEHEARLGDPTGEADPDGQSDLTPATQYVFAGHCTHWPPTIE